MIEEDQETLAEALSSLTDKEYKFWTLMDSGKYTQLQAYRQSFDTTSTNDKAVSVDACKLWNSPKLTLVRKALTATKVTQTIRSREERIAELEKTYNYCMENKQFGAAIRAQELLGKLEGHYVEKHETIKRNESVEDSLRKVHEQYGDEVLIKVANSRGIPEMADKILGNATRH